MTHVLRGTLGRLLFAIFCGLLLAGCNRAETGQAPGERDAASADPSAQSALPQIVVTKTGIEMALLPAGKFLMGDTQGEEDEKPAREVDLSAFYIDVCEVPQASYQALMGAIRRSSAATTGRSNASVGSSRSSTATCGRSARGSSPATT